jgi:rSAM/selenodomain-associated transferase 1
MEHVILFAKTPRLHRVKTRLAPHLTAEQALLLYEAMLSDQTRFLGALAASGRSCEVCLDSQQGEGDLGARMDRALRRAFASGASAAAILGADAPTLPRSLLDDAFGRLAGGADAVIIPALDGGYVLVGASRPVPALFAEVPWGTPLVQETTRRIAREAGVDLAETAPWWDVDVEGDVRRLARELAADPSRAPATASLLLRLGLYAPQNPMV